MLSKRHERWSWNPLVLAWSPKVVVSPGRAEPKARLAEENTLFSKRKRGQAAGKRRQLDSHSASSCGKVNASEGQARGTGGSPEHRSAHDWLGGR